MLADPVEGAVLLEVLQEPRDRTDEAAALVPAGRPEPENLVWRELQPAHGILVARVAAQGAHAALVQGSQRACEQDSTSVALGTTPHRLHTRMARGFFSKVSERQFRAVWKPTAR
ncbi:hypothetical protein HPB47_005556 [Ixodes persulcatus]|uniref:Uncharacterized protein n=1 Tax=Ixodes persulcatus TaxID=34615 RepID=A0AC60PCP7_IXOPE|nr:hypothetical protein HPB47_005556 [Ixodes persulcatus]